MPDGKIIDTLKKCFEHRPDLTFGALVFEIYASRSTDARMNLQTLTDAYFLEACERFIKIDPEKTRSGDAALRLRPSDRSVQEPPASAQVIRPGNVKFAAGIRPKPDFSPIIPLTREDVIADDADDEFDSPYVPRNEISDKPFQFVQDTDSDIPLIPIDVDGLDSDIDEDEDDAL